MKKRALLSFVAWASALVVPAPGLIIVHGAHWCDLSRGGQREVTQPSWSAEAPDPFMLPQDPTSTLWTGMKPRMGSSCCSSQMCSHHQAASTVPLTWKPAPWAAPSFGSSCGVRGRGQRLWVGWEAESPVGTSCGSPEAPGSPVLSSSGQVGEGRLLKTRSSRLWGWALGARLYQRVPRLPTWRCLP